MTPRQADGELGTESEDGVVPTVGHQGERQRGEIRVLVGEQATDEAVIDVDLGGRHVLRRHGRYSVSNSGRCNSRRSFEKTSIGFSVGRRIPRCRIRICVCWLYSTSVTAQPSRPARAVRPERCR